MQQIVSGELIPFPDLYSMEQVARDKLIGLGTCIGKFTHAGKFRLTIGALDVLAQHAKYKASAARECLCCERAWVGTYPAQAPPWSPMTKHDVTNHRITPCG